MYVILNFNVLTNIDDEYFKSWKYRSQLYFIRFYTFTGSVVLLILMWSCYLASNILHQIVNISIKMMIWTIRQYDIWIHVEIVRLKIWFPFWLFLITIQNKRYLTLRRKTDRPQIDVAYNSNNNNMKQFLGKVASFHQVLNCRVLTVGDIFLKMYVTFNLESK